jgi:hypothetical protein
MNCRAGHRFDKFCPTATKPGFDASGCQPGPLGSIQAAVKTRLHPSGRLSDRYYARLPSAMDGPQQRSTGWIECGRPGGRPYQAADYDGSVLQPERAWAWLFPSSLRHRTAPFKSAGKRAGIACEAMRETWCLAGREWYEPPYPYAAA